MMENGPTQRFCIMEEHTGRYVGSIGLAEGVFDIEDLVFRTKELSEFVDSAAEQYDFDRALAMAP
jgi:predicted esterase